MSDAAPQLLAGKTGLILNIANDRSIAWHIANQCAAAGATCGYGFLPVEKMERRARKALDQLPLDDDYFLQGCDVGNDDSIADYFEAAGERFGKIDFLVHSLAFADRTYLAHGKFMETPREVFTQSLDISAYSLIALARAAAPLMNDGGSILALTYLGSTKAVPGYNVMGVAKAALESTSRYLALELGEKNIRVNTLSAGPVRTLSAMAVGGIDEMFDHTEKKAPLKRNITGDEVGKNALYLLSDLSSGVTGENIFVDAGFNIVGL
jgi:enoyl-[acyl-carrier protein] reductase I